MSHAAGSVRQEIIFLRDVAIYAISVLFCGSCRRSLLCNFSSRYISGSLLQKLNLHGVKKGRVLELRGSLFHVLYNHGSILKVSLVLTERSDQFTQKRRSLKNSNILHRFLNVILRHQAMRVKLSF